MALFDQNRADFNRSIAMVRGQTRGLEIEYNERIGAIFA